MYVDCTVSSLLFWVCAVSMIETIIPVLHTHGDTPSNTQSHSHTLVKICLFLYLFAYEHAALCTSHAIDERHLLLREVGAAFVGEESLRLCVNSAHYDSQSQNEALSSSICVWLLS